MPNDLQIRIASTDPRLKRQINHDSRAYRADLRGLSNVDIEHTSPIAGKLDQGAVGDCTWNAATYVLSSDVHYPHETAAVQGDITASVNDQTLWIQPCYSLEEQADGNGTYPPTDDGSSGPTSGKVAKQLGLIAGYTHILSTNPEDTGAALQAGPGSWGTLWKTGMDDVNTSTGQVKYSGTTRGGHELCIFKNVVAAEQLWFWQSWGSWGYKGLGMGWISYDDFAKSMKDQGDVTFFTPLTATPPTPLPPVGDAADAALIAALDPWEKTIVSRITKAGKAKIAYNFWKSAKGY